MRLFRQSVDRNDAPGRRRQPASELPQAAELEKRYAFRRNRTLTGSSSAAVASGAELNAELRSPRAHVHHLTSLRRRLWLILVAATTVAFGLYLLISQMVASVVVRVSGIETVPKTDEDAYVRSLDRYYAARPSERLRFLLDEAALTSHIQATRPEIADVRLEPGATIGEAGMVLTPRIPIARWNVDGDDRYVDESGVVYVRNFGAEPRLRIIDESGIRFTSERGKALASDRFLSFIGRVIASADENNLTVSRVVIPALTTRQVDLLIKGQVSRYKLSVDRSVGEQIEDMARISRYLKQRGLNPKYVDVRIKGKAFYR